MVDEQAVLTLDLPDRHEAVAAARKALTALNGSLHLVSEARLRDAQLLISELVSNAIRHAAGAPRLVVHAAPATMRVEVHDGGPGFDPARLPEPTIERSGGWGLRIVDTLAHRWGVEKAHDGTAVWFEIDRPRREKALPIRNDQTR